MNNPLIISLLCFILFLNIGMKMTITVSSVTEFLRSEKSVPVGVIKIVVSWVVAGIFLPRILFERIRASRKTNPYDNN